MEFQSLIGLCIEQALNQVASWVQSSDPGQLWRHLSFVINRADSAAADAMGGHVDGLGAAADDQPARAWPAPHAARAHLHGRLVYRYS